MRALVVEDDADIREDIADALNGAGFIVDVAADGDSAWSQGEIEDYEIAILDLGLPRLDGLSVLRQWRSGGCEMPVIILSARSDWTEKVTGIEAGADDYLAKPFEMGELIARVRGLLRRRAGRLSNIVQLGELALDTVRLSATYKGAPTRLSPLEFRLLDYLAHQAGKAISAGELADHLYGTSSAVDPNAIEALVARLRRRYGASLIETRRGFGYVAASA